ncbi:unnamed protein product [Ectocarpus sp. 13 AM-2016]
MARRWSERANPRAGKEAPQPRWRCSRSRLEALRQRRSDTPVSATGRMTQIRPNWSWISTLRRPLPYAMAPRGRVPGREERNSRATHRCLR